MGAKTVQLQAWLGRNEAKASVDPDTVDMAAVFVAADEYSAQSLAATAADLAAEDVMLVLDKALQSGMLPLDAYLKQVREGVWVGGSQPVRHAAVGRVPEAGVDATVILKEPLRCLILSF